MESQRIVLLNSEVLWRTCKKCRLPTGFFIRTVNFKVSIEGLKINLNT